jgi:hypothetical protein
MLFPPGTRVIIAPEAYCIEYDQGWIGDPVHLYIRQVGWPDNPDWPDVYGFVVPIDHARELRDPKSSTKMVDERTGGFYMFVDSMVEGMIKEFPLDSSMEERSADNR